MSERLNRIYIEVSNICNLQCHFCPEVERANQTLSKEKFEGVLTQVKPYTDQVCLHVMGEPLGHPDFNDLIGLCSKHQLKVLITTNATLLKPQNVLALLSSTVGQVNISLQSFAANLKSDDYFDKLERYLKGIFDFVDRARAERSDLYVQFRMWNQGATESPLEEHVNQEMLRRIEEKFAVKVDFSKINLQFKKSYPLGGKFSVQFDSRFRWPNIKDDILSDVGFCHALTSHVAIHADGKVVPCCLDKEAEIELGNIFETKLSEILKTKRSQDMKRGFAKGILAESLCQRCDFIKRFDNKAQKLNSVREFTL